MYCLVFSTSFFLLYLPIRLVEVVLLVVALSSSSSSSSLPSFLLPPLPFLLPFCSLFLPVYTTTCDSTKKKRKRTGLHTLNREHRICRELKSAQQRRAMAVQAAAAAAATQQQRAHADTQAKGKENLGRQGGIHTCRRITTFTRKKVPNPIYSTALLIYPPSYSVLHCL